MAGEIAGLCPPAVLGPVQLCLSKLSLRCLPCSKLVTRMEGRKSWPTAVVGEEHAKDSAQDIRYYLVLQEERSALKEALCLLNISTASGIRCQKPRAEAY